MTTPIRIVPRLLSCGTSVLESFYASSLAIQILLELLLPAVMGRLSPAVVGTKLLSCATCVLESYYALYLDTQTGFLTVAISPDGQTLISGSKDKTARIWNLSTGSLIGTFFRHSDWVLSVAFSLDRQTLISGSKDKTIKVLSLKGDQQARRQAQSCQFYVFSII